MENRQDEYNKINDKTTKSAKEETDRRSRKKAVFRHILWFILMYFVLYIFLYFVLYIDEVEDSTLSNRMGHVLAILSVVITVSFEIQEWYWILKEHFSEKSFRYMKKTQDQKNSFSATERQPLTPNGIAFSIMVILLIVSMHFPIFHSERSYGVCIGVLIVYSLSVLIRQIGKDLF